MLGLEQAISDIQTAERDLVEATAKAVVEAVKAAGAITVLAHGAIPATGMLMYVHPNVYDRIKELSKEEE